jgi:AcrR family transcriptional regulator
MKSLPISYSLAEFRELVPLNEVNIWAFLLDRNAERIGVKRREVALENLEKIFVATFSLANTVGFRAMTLRDLCRETGLSMGGLYGYIQSKDQLADMIQDAANYVSEMLPIWFRHLPEPIDELEGILRAHIYLSEIFQPWAYFVFLESRAMEDGRGFAKESEASVQGHLRKLIQESGDFNPEEAMLLGSHCISMLQDWHLKRWKFGSKNINADAFANSVVRFVRSYIQMNQIRPGNGASNDEMLLCG